MAWRLGAVGLSLLLEDVRCRVRVLDLGCNQVGCAGGSALVSDASERVPARYTRQVCIFPHLYISSYVPRY